MEAYLEEHKVREAIAAAVAEMLRQRPENPLNFIGQQLLAASEPAPIAAASKDPRGLVDTSPGQQDVVKAAMARDLASGIDLASKFAQLTDLSFKKAGLMVLPPQIGTCMNLKKLDLSLNPALCAMPTEMGQLRSLRILFTLGCAFTEVPTVLGTLPSLYMLSFKSNRLSTISEGALAPSLEWLILTDNRLEALPQALPLGLRKVMLTNNRLRSLPASICLCLNLELIRLADNQLTSLPTNFLAMPKLSWVALSGNPIVARPAAKPLPPPNWIGIEKLVVGEQLGAGGGGFVHRATWAARPDAPPCAIKIFRDAGTVTDGDPLHEIDLGSALQHPNVIQVLGASPAPRLGLVLELLDTKSQWAELGKPPNFDTCTRDTYAAGTTFSPAHVCRTLHGVAAACVHLHAAGFTHGDLYAHNTLVDTTTGEAKVGDFGAAYSYEPMGYAGAHGVTWRSIERLEVRAFGCLAEELLAHMAPASSAISKAVEHVVQRCMDPEVLMRPSFAELTKLLPLDE